MAVSMTYNPTAGALASTSLGAGASNSTCNLDFSAVYGGWVQIKDTGGGTVAATNGCKVEVFARLGSSLVTDTVVLFGFTITTVVSVASYKSFRLPPGKYNVKLTNLDATNGITVEITTATVDAI